MHRVLAVLVAIGVGAASLSAHEVTYRGTVTAIEETSVRVKIVDADTQRELELTFHIDEETKIFRGDAAVTLAEADIRLEDPIAVTINDDYDDMFAVVIRLEAERVQPEAPPGNSGS